MSSAGQPGRQATCCWELEPATHQGKPWENYFLTVDRALAAGSGPGEAFLEGLWTLCQLGSFIAPFLKKAAPGTLANAFDPRYLGGGDGEDHSLRPA
jgi:hypothetical protein